MKPVIAILLLCVSGQTLANSNCDTPTNDFDGLYCLRKVYEAADKELNDAYKKLTKQLDKEGKDALKTGQLAWIEQRNTNCSRRDEHGFFVNMDCATNTTIERLRFLQDRSRECASSGCQNSKLY